jgi:bifunctional DNA-binding transcriptional regulator/antitoxin component of YhaV-PrlF toxin-antitoxin module
MTRILGQAGILVYSTRARFDSSAVSLLDARPLRLKTVSMTYHGYLAVQGRGIVALPAELRRKYRLDEAGAQIEITEREDGVLELRPALPVPVGEVWFWTPGHQAAEQQAEAERAEGRFRQYDDAEALLADFQETIDGSDDEASGL